MESNTPAAAPAPVASRAGNGSVRDAAEIAQNLKSLMRHHMPEARDIDIRGLLRASSGLSRENWSFDATWRDADGGHERRLMLLRDAAGSLLNTDRTREFAVLKALEGTPVPAPAAHWIDRDGRWLGTPCVVMDRLPGVCEYLVLNGERPLETRLALARDFITMMANVHAVDWRGRGLAAVLDMPTPTPALFELAHWESEYRRVQLEPHPEMDFVLDWLRRAAPPASGIVLVHGDFKPGNALILEDRITAKLDWETAHLGDPLEDLGWVTTPVRKREHQIPGAWEREQIVAAYRALTGREVERTHLLWWNVLANWKLAVIQLTGISEFVAGRYDRVFQTPAWLYRPMFQLMEAAA